RARLTLFPYTTLFRSDLAEQLGRLLSVIRRGVCGAGVPFDARGLQRLAEHRLPVSHAGQRRGIEARERMEGIALDLGARDGGIEDRKSTRLNSSHVKS